MINFYLPDFYHKSVLNAKLIELLSKNPNYFYDNISIGAIYGTFPGAIWNGGRQVSGIANKSQILRTIHNFNEKGIPLRFTFTNCLLEEKHLYDTYCNLIVECANNGMNEILVNSLLLEEYLRINYPNYKYILSTTTCERDINKINSACQRYEMVVPDYRDTVNDTFLNALEHKEKIEILINSYCSPYCSRRKQHYEVLSKGQLTFSGISDITSECECQYKPFLDILDSPVVIKVEDLYKKYTDLGFSNFKIEGRLLNNLDVVESYVYYLVKPEFKDRVRYILLKEIFTSS